MTIERCLETLDADAHHHRHLLRLIVMAIRERFSNFGRTCRSAVAGRTFPGPVAGSGCDARSFTTDGPRYWLHRGILRSFCYCYFLWRPINVPELRLFRIIQNEGRNYTSLLLPVVTSESVVYRPRLDALAPTTMKERSKDKFRAKVLRKRSTINRKLSSSISQANANKKSKTRKLSRRAASQLVTKTAPVRSMTELLREVSGSTARASCDVTSTMDARSLLNGLLSKTADGKLALPPPAPVGTLLLPPSGDEDAVVFTDEDDDDNAGSKKPAVSGMKAPVTTAGKGMDSELPPIAMQYEKKGPKYLFWERSGLHPSLVQSLRSMKFTHPTPVQEAALPIILQRHIAKDVVVASETGSGKTLVFVLPVLHSILSGYASNVQLQQQPKGKKKASAAAVTTAVGEKRSRQDADAPAKGVAVEGDDLLDYPGRVMHSLMVTPTRELANQIERCFKQLCTTPLSKRIRVLSVVGGMAPEKQQRLINRKPHVMLCTPGRIWDLVCKNEGCFLGHSISRRLTYLVLDEADRLLQGVRFAELHKILERVRCETLPSSGTDHFARDDVVGDPSMGALVEGEWDPIKEKFIAKKPTAASAPAKPATVSKGKMLSSKKRRQQKKVGATTTDGSDATSEEEEDDDDDEADGRHHRTARDAPMAMPFPPPPFKPHRLVTIITSATLSLEMNYSKKNRRTQQFIRTRAVDTLAGVLKELGLRPAGCHVFDIKPPPESSVAARIHETMLRCPEDTKELYLYYFLRVYPERTIVFVNAISMLRRITKILDILGIPVACLHASMQQRQRLRCIDRFRTGAIRVLIATDVAARGLDVEGIKYIIHFQVPRSTDAYIHRCGRTARCGGTGFSILYVSPDEFTAYKKLVESQQREDGKHPEPFAVDQTIVKQLRVHYRMALDIDDLARAGAKTLAAQRWVTQTSDAADLDAGDLRNEEAEVGHRRQLKTIEAMKRRLSAIVKVYNCDASTGRSAFPSAARVVGAGDAVDASRKRAGRQVRMLEDRKAVTKAAAIRKDRVRQFKARNDAKASRAD